MLPFVERARVGRMAKDSFAEEMKRHQLSWALANGVTPDMLETRRGQRCRNVRYESFLRGIASNDFE